MNSVQSGEAVGDAIWQTLALIAGAFLSHLWLIVPIAVLVAVWLVVDALIPKRRRVRV